MNELGGLLVFTLRIHHVFDIIRDLGQNKELSSHQFGHSYHLVAKEFYSGIREFKLTISNDDICGNCVKLENNICIDSVDHRKDFVSKQMFNDYLDNRIMSILKVKDGTILNHSELVDIADAYINNIEYIYSGNDKNHTEKRKSNVIKGIEILKHKEEPNAPVVRRDFSKY